MCCFSVTRILKGALCSFRQDERDNHWMFIYAEIKVLCSSLDKQTKQMGAFFNLINIFNITFLILIIFS